MAQSYNPRPCSAEEEQQERKLQALIHRREELDRLIYRENCRITCLEATLQRINYDEVDDVVDKLEAAKDKVKRLGAERIDVCWEANSLSFKLMGANSPWIGGA